MSYKFRKIVSLLIILILVLNTQNNVKADSNEELPQLWISIGDVSGHYPDIKYGVKSFYGDVYIIGGWADMNNVLVYYTYKGKRYSTYTNEDGEFKFKNIPLIEAEDYITIYAEKDGFEKGSFEASVDVELDEDSDIWHYWSYASSKKQHGYVYNAHRGDTLIVSVGKKKYKKKFDKNTKKYHYSFKTKKYSAGTKIKFQLISKYGDRWVDYADVVYKYKTFKVGDSKKHVKLTAGYRYPNKKTKSSYGETWWYDDAYISFDNNGLINYWYIDD